MRRLAITEKTETRPVAIRSWDVEPDCQTIVYQLVNSIPKDVLLRTSYVEHQQLTSTQPTHGVSLELKFSMARWVQFVAAKKVIDAQALHLEMKHCPGNRFYSGELRNMMSKSEGDCADSITSSLKFFG